MALFALDMGYKAHSTSIALLARIIQALLHRQRRIAHVFPSSNYKAQIIKPEKMATHAATSIFKSERAEILPCLGMMGNRTERRGLYN
jgi:hypothetical protein